MLIIKPTKEQKQIDAIKALIAQYVGDGGTPVRMPDGSVVYPLDANGEGDFDQGTYNGLAAMGVPMDGGYFFAVVPTSIIDNLVDTDLPDSKYFDSDNVEQRRVYNEYFRFNYDLQDGTHLIQLVHFPYSASYDPDNPNSIKGGTVELTDENRRAFEKELGVTAMVKSVGLPLQPVEQQM